MLAVTAGLSFVVLHNSMLAFLWSSFQHPPDSDPPLPQDLIRRHVHSVQAEAGQPHGPAPRGDGEPPVGQAQDRSRGRLLALCNEDGGLNSTRATSIIWEDCSSNINAPAFEQEEIRNILLHKEVCISDPGHTHR